jgi:hypothetical protein
VVATSSASHSDQIPRKPDALAQLKIAAEHEAPFYRDSLLPAMPTPATAPRPDRHHGRGEAEQVREKPRAGYPASHAETSRAHQEPGARVLVARPATQPEQRGRHRAALIRQTDTRRRLPCASPTCTTTKRHIHRYLLLRMFRGSPHPRRRRAGGRSAPDQTRPAAPNHLWPESGQPVDARRKQHTDSATVPTPRSLAKVGACAPLMPPG